jgi:preprotein translocase subunit SecE
MAWIKEKPGPARETVMRRILTFIREAKAELMKVDWPNRSQVVHNTLIVIGLTFVTAVFLGGLDYGLSYLLREFVMGA